MFKFRNPWLSALLQILAPGLGALYSGAPVKALLTVGASLLFGTVGAGLIWAGKNGLLTFLPLAVGFFIFLVADGVRSARKANAALRPLSAWNKWYIYVSYVVVIAAVSAFGRGAIKENFVESWRVPSAAMAPTILPGDHFVGDKLSRTPRRGDIIYFRYPPEPDKYFLKRVIGVPGDTVRVRDGKVEVEGVITAAEPAGSFSSDDTFGHTEYSVWRESIGGRSYRMLLSLEDPVPGSREFGPQKVPANMYFVLGDNRDRSNDSRLWGFVPGENLRGQPVYLYWPPARFGLRVGVDETLK